VSRAAGTLLRTALWALLGTWLGGLVLFSVVVAPTAFQVFPPAQAGRLVGPVLGFLNVYGVAAGAVLAGLAVLLARPWPAWALPLAMGLLAAVSEWGITPAIDAVRSRAFAPEPDPAALQAFGRLHGLSMLLFAVVGIGTLLLTWLHARSEARPG